MAQRNALGRGLDALFSMDEVKTEGSSSINEIELSKITVNPNQPRHEFDPVALQELSLIHIFSVTEYHFITGLAVRMKEEACFGAGSVSYTHLNWCSTPSSSVM